MVDWNAYEYRLGIMGEIARDRIVDAASANLSSHRTVHPACKEFRKGARRVNLLIRSTADGYTYIFIVLPGQKVSLNIGDIVSYQDRRFIITERYFDNDFVERGQMEQCNHLFRFQNGTPDIIEIYGIVENPYSRSNVSGRVVEEPFNQMKFILPKNQDTEKIYIGKRFMVEVGYNQNGERQPVVYRVVMLGSATDQYDDGGIMTVSLEYSPAEEDDSIEEMIANFIPQDESEAMQNPYERTEIIGNGKIKVGMGWNTYEARFYREDWTLDTDTIPVWSVDASALPDGALESCEQDGVLTLRVSGGLPCVGKMIHVSCTGMSGLCANYDVKVVAPY